MHSSVLKKLTCSLSLLLSATDQWGHGVAPPVITNNARRIATCRPYSHLIEKSSLLLVHACPRLQTTRVLQQHKHPFPKSTRSGPCIFQHITVSAAKYIFASTRFSPEFSSPRRFRSAADAFVITRSSAHAALFQDRKHCRGATLNPHAHHRVLLRYPLLFEMASIHDASSFPTPPSFAEAGWIPLTVSHRKQTYTFELPGDAPVSDLFDEIADVLGIPVCNQKILVPKGPLLKTPFKDPNMPLSTLQNKSLTLIGSPAAEVEAVQNICDKIARSKAARLAQQAKLKPKKKAFATLSQDDTRYTFLQVKPLQGLPRPDRSYALLMRLKEDPGIRAAMKKHKFTVSLLTEMEPLSHTQTTHEGTSRTLGLNRNQGEVIELRLRTDAHDGYRDYKTIRKTLCHELAHNVHGPHNSQFWDLCRQLEREVDAADWKSGGHTIGESSRYVISGQAGSREEQEDEGGWTGGEFVLGGVSHAGTGLTRRDILAQAALERQMREDGAEKAACDAAERGWRPCQRSQQPSDKRK